MEGISRGYIALRFAEAWAFLLCGPYLVCQIDLVHLMSYIVYWYEPSDLAYEISHLIWHMRSAI